jgi:hypothetical protein
VARNPWPGRGLPLARRPLPARADGTAAASLPPPAGAHGRLTDLVRECLLCPPQPGSLYVARPGQPEGRKLQRARAAHGLEPWEELIAVWQWAKVAALFSTAPSSLIFTGRGIRIAEPRLRLSIAYDAFRDCTFRFEFSPGGRGSPDVSELVIDGPTPWRSPNADQTAELITDDLTRIKELVAQPS